MFMYHLGIVLMIWIGLGFISGIKALLFDKPTSEESIEDTKDYLDIDENDPSLDVLKDKKLYLAYSILLGPIGIIADLYGRFKYRNEEGKEDDE